MHRLPATHRPISLPQRPCLVSTRRPSDADAQNVATHKPSFSLPRSFSLHRLWTSASTISGSVQPASWLGVTWDREDSGGKRTWVVKITKFGLWLLVLHLLLAAAGIFNLITTIYSWTSGNDTDDMLQRILKNTADSDTYLHGLDEKLVNWVDEAKNRSAAEKARVREEQRLWDALLKVFKDCAVSQAEKTQRMLATIFDSISTTILFRDQTSRQLLEET